MVKRRDKVTFIIQSRSVSIYDNRGKRVRNARKGNWVSWVKRPETALNFRDAVGFVTKRMFARPAHIGAIVVIRIFVNDRPEKGYTKLYEAKWGTDGKPYTSYTSPVGEWWRRQAKLPLNVGAHLR